MQIELPKNIKYFFLSDLFSQFGAGISFVGLNWFVFQKTGSNSAIAILMAINIISGLIILPLAGLIVDLYNRKFVILCSNFLRIFFVLLALIVFSLKDFNIIYAYILAIVHGIAWNVYITASRALIQQIVTKQELLKGNSFMETSLQVGMFSAGALSGLIYKFCGIQAILLLDIIAFSFGNFFLYFIKYESFINASKNNKMTYNFMLGLKFLRNNPVIFIFGIIIFLPYIATVSFNVVLPGYVQNHLKSDSVMFGLLDMSYGIGASLAGAIVLYLTKKNLSKNFLVIIFFITSISALLFMNINYQYFFAGLATLLFGLPNSAIRIILNTKLMEMVPKEYMGRSMSIWGFCSAIMQITSISIVGKLMDNVGTSYGYNHLFYIMLLAFISYILLYKAIRNAKSYNES